MNKRLKLIADHVSNGKGLADIGTDHGYLPVYLALNGYDGSLYASDINSDPLNKAVKNASAAGVSDRISFKLSDGLKDCPRNEIDTIVIAGMGGDMIVKILDEAEWCLSPDYKLILQPMTKAEVVRYWLVYNGFEISQELLADENGSFYQIIIASFGGYTRLNDAELYIGSFELAEEKELYTQQFSLVHKRFERAVNEMKIGEFIPESRLGLFEDILKQFGEMRDSYGFC